MPRPREAASSASMPVPTRSAIVCGSMRLLSSEARGAFLEEGRDPLAIVVAAAQFALGVALEVELLLEALALRRVDRLLGAGKAEGGTRGELCGHLPHRG